MNEAEKKVDSRSPSRTRTEGLVDLVAEAVVQGARVVENAHRGITTRNFWLARQLPVVAEPVAIVQAVHDAHLTVVYGSIRGVARAAQVIAGAVLEGAATSTTDRPRDP
jgi:hypothetical protein